jgi:DNA-binding HxlR family transcriptional regulator
METATTGCGLDTVLLVVGGKWKTAILGELDERPRRFGELRRRIDGVSEKVLTQQLRELEADGIVHREQFDEIPPRVEYSLTDAGRELNALLEPLCAWGDANHARVTATRCVARPATASARC